MTRASICTPRTSYGSRNPISVIRTKHLELGFLFLVAICTVVHGQLFRRPATTASTRSPAMQEYRQKWVEFLRQRTTVSPLTLHYSHPSRVSVSSGAGNKLVINGFPCERTYDLFPSKNNPRMYHLCARSRDNWYVYHYFCPLGSIFNDGQKRCVQNRTDITTSNIRTTTARTRRPSSSSTAVPLTPSTTTATTMKVPSTTTTTTEAPVPEPATEALLLSSEEFSTEEEMGTRDVVVHDYTMIAGSDEIEEVTKENDESSDESNMIPESDNESSRLQVSTSSTSPPEVRPKEMKKKATMLPLKKKKSKEVADADASGGRRPRILKKWRDYINKY